MKFLLAQAPVMGGPSPPPMPVAAPFLPALPSQTEKGIRYMSYTLLLFLASSALGVVLVLLLAPIIAQIVAAGTTGTVDPALLGALVGFVAAACGLLLVSLIGLIMGLIGLFALHKGGPEFGADHAKRVERGLILLVVGILVPGVGQSIVSIGSAAGIPTGPGLSIPFPNPVSIGASMAFGALQAILVGLFLLWTIERLTAPPGLLRARLALALGVAGGLAGGTINLAFFATVPAPTLGDLGVLIATQGVLTGGFSIASLGLWYSAYADVLRRLRRRELQPAPPAWMYYPPPMYSPPPAYVQAPQTPPSSPAPPPEKPPGSP